MLFAFFTISFLQRHVYNNDFWWHLATGKYIIENRSLPEDDPFNYTSSGAPETRKTMILKGNWLADVIFYKVYTAWDFKGIIILRALVLITLMSVVFLTIRKQGISDLLSLLLTTGVFAVTKDFLGERPQLFTFLSFAVVLYLLEDFRMHRSRKIFLVLPIVLVLSNMHPGFIVCILLVSLYLAGEILSSLFYKDGRKRKIGNLAALWGLSFVFAAFNPAGLDVFGELFGLGKITRGVVEFMPPFYLYTKKVIPPSYPYILFLLLSLLSLIYLRRIGIARMLVLSVFTIMSFDAIRYMMFYMVISAPVIAAIFVEIRNERRFAGISGFLYKWESIFFSIFLLISGYLTINSLQMLARFEFKADTSFSAPKGAADFLADLQIKGNIFNENGFGGYLIWRLHPGKKVFSDGRALNPDSTDEYRIIAHALTANGLSWNRVIEKYNISYIVTPPLLPSGQIYPIVEKLFDSDIWELIYSDHFSLIFMKRNNENISIIERFVKDKSKGLDTIIFQASAKASKNKTNPYYFISIGKAFFRLGKLKDSERAFELAYSIDSDNPEIQGWLQKVKKDK